MLGTIAGDIIGSVHEKARHRAKDFTPLFHPRVRFTDDTVCMVTSADTRVALCLPAMTPWRVDIDC